MPVRLPPIAAIRGLGMRVFVVIGLLLLCAWSLAAQTPTSPSEVSLLKARVIQLEAQVSVLTARLALATHALNQPQFEKTRKAIEAEAGCALDWAAVPPVCQPTSQKGR